MKQCTLNITLFAKLKCPPMCIMSQFAKLIVKDIYVICAIVFCCCYFWQILTVVHDNVLGP